MFLKVARVPIKPFRSHQVTYEHVWKDDNEFIFTLTERPNWKIVL